MPAHQKTKAAANKAQRSAQRTKWFNSNVVFRANIADSFDGGPRCHVFVFEGLIIFLTLAGLAQPLL